LVCSPGMDRPHCSWSVALTLGILALACGAAPAGEPRVQGRAEVAANPNGLSPLARVAPAPISAANVERVRLSWEALAGGFARAVAVERSVGRVVFSNESETRVYALKTGGLQGTLKACDDVVRAGLFFHGSALLVVCRHAVERHDVVAKNRLAALEVNQAAITAAARSGKRLALAHRDGVVRVHDLETGGVVEIVVPGPPIDVKSLALDKAGERLALAWVQGSIWWWRLDEPTKYQRLVRYEHESDTVTFAPNGYFAEEGRAGTTSVWDFTSPEPKKLFELKNGDWIKRLLFTRDSAWLVRGGS